MGAGVSQEGVFAQRVTDRYMIRLAVREIVVAPEFHARSAALQDLTPQVLEAFGEGFLLPARTASFGGLVKSLSKLLDFFKKAPKAWERIKQFLGIESLSDIPGAIKEWAKRGLVALRKLFGHIPDIFPLAALFIPKGKGPTLSDLIHRIMAKNPLIARALEGINGGVVKIDEWLDKYLPTLKRPLLAAAFIYIWMNVGELSWDIPTLINGFLGAISFGDLIASLPESALGKLILSLGFGGSLGPVWMGAFPIAIVFRLIWLVRGGYVEWVPGKGFLVKWDKITGEPARAEPVPVF